MKKIIAMVVCLVLVISLEGCGIEAEQGEKEPIENQHSEKKVLKLQYFPELDEDELYLEQTEPIAEIVDIAYSNLIEIAGEQYINNQEMQGFTDYIKCFQY